MWDSISAISLLDGVKRVRVSSSEGGLESARSDSIAGAPAIRKPVVKVRRVRARKRGMRIERGRLVPVGGVDSCGCGGGGEVDVVDVVAFTMNSHVSKSLHTSFPTSHLHQANTKNQLPSLMDQNARTVITYRRSMSKNYYYSALSMLILQYSSPPKQDTNSSLYHTHPHQHQPTRRPAAGAAQTCSRQHSPAGPHASKRRILRPPPY